MSYIVKITHLRPCSVFDSTDTELVVEDVKTFKTKKAAAQYLIEQKEVADNLGRKTKLNKASTELGILTGKTWQETDTGEYRQEYYRMIVTKQV